MKRTLALSDLNDPREAAFVTAIFELGGPHYAGEAALRAGYADTVEDAERAAAFLLGASRIQRVITTEIKSRFDVAAATAFNTLLEVCVNPKAPANARISAATEILNRSSVGPVPSRSTNVTANVSIEDFLARLDDSEDASNAKVIEGSSAIRPEDT